MKQSQGIEPTACRAGEGLARVGVLLAWCGLVFACGGDSPSTTAPGPGAQVGGPQTPASPVTGMMPAAAPPAADMSSGVTTPASTPAAPSPSAPSVGAPSVGAPIAGMPAMGTDPAATPATGAGVPVAMDPTVADPTGMSPAMDPAAMAPIAAGPLTLPSPNEVGPYEVVEEENVGQGFENAIAANDRGDGSGCESFILSFGQDPEEGRRYARIPEGHDMALYTLYRPAEIPEGVKLPALSWANGTCAHPNGYADMLHHIVSHGFLIIAAHSRYTGSGEAQINGLDWLLEQNENAESPLYGHVDSEAVGIFGHSQGSGSTSNAARDPRVKSIVFMHGNANNAKVPALYLSSDIEALILGLGYEANSGPAAIGKLNNSDHITMMVEHERMAPEVTAWFRYTLLNDEESKTWFAGPDCMLCNDPEWEYSAKNLP